MLVNFRRLVPRWVVLLFDVIVVLIAAWISFQVRFNFRVPEHEMEFMRQGLITIIGVRLIFFLIFGSYRNIIRYTSTTDALRMAIVLLSGSLVFTLANIVSAASGIGIHLVPYSIIIIELTMTSVFILGYRILLKIAFLEINAPSREKRWVIIFGAGESGIITKRAIDRDAGSKYRVLAFIDDDPRKVGKRIEGILIRNEQQFEELLKSNDVAHVILSIQKLSAERKVEITDLCLQHNTKVLVVPPVSRWINGELSFKQIRKINIEELLEREEIRIANDKISDEIVGKVILVSGAAGSIGSEIVRQVSQHHPALLICVDQAETPLFHLENELRSVHQCPYKIIVADICNENRMQQIFDEYKPSLVFHAAAYKHVPMMELNACEAIRNNVMGTRVLADLSMQHDVDKFVFISTDKAVNPTNIMGASKRIAEMYVQAHNQVKKTRFITTRFGNVLGSNGSVIPLFRKQIESGGPVTVTDPEVTRFFMTIPEACSLVLEAGTMGKGGEIFIFDMGESVRIIDLAKKMIQLSGLVLGRDIQIQFTGLRPGEKLYEELLADRENTLPTYHQRIMIAKVEPRDPTSISNEALLLTDLANQGAEIDAVLKMKALVPEFQSKNSVFEKLDN